MVHVVYSAVLPPISTYILFLISPQFFFSPFLIVIVCPLGPIIQRKRFYSFSFSEAFSLLSTASRYSFVVT